MQGGITLQETFELPEHVETEFSTAKALFQMFGDVTGSTYLTSHMKELKIELKEVQEKLREKELENHDLENDNDRQSVTVSNQRGLLSNLSAGNREADELIKMYEDLNQSNLPFHIREEVIGISLLTISVLVPLAICMLTSTRAVLISAMLAWNFLVASSVMRLFYGKRVRGEIKHKKSKIRDLKKKYVESRKAYDYVQDLIDTQ